jgi:centractin
LLTEAPLNPRSNRDTAAQILFETFNVPALHTSIQAVLSLYASGRTTGMVLDSGDGVSHAVPVYEGFAMPSAIRRIDVAGRDVTEHLQLLLRKAGYVLQTSAEKEVVRGIKEKVCFVAADPKREEKEWAQMGHGVLARDAKGKEEKVVEYVLPDGAKIKVGVERFRAPEILFDPELIGSEYPGVHQIVVDAINRTDMDLRKALFGNIVLSGGATLTKGFGDRLLHEVQRLAVKDMRIKIFAPPERKYSTWIGGSILAGLSTFRKVSLYMFCLLHCYFFLSIRCHRAQRGQGVWGLAPMESTQAKECFLLSVLFGFILYGGRPPNPRASLRSMAMKMMFETGD